MEVGFSEVKILNWKIGSLKKSGHYGCYLWALQAKTVKYSSTNIQKWLLATLLCYAAIDNHDLKLGRLNIPYKIIVSLILFLFTTKDQPYLQKWLSMCLELPLDSKFQNDSNSQEWVFMFEFK